MFFLRFFPFYYCLVCLRFLSFLKRFFTFGQVKGNARHGRSRHQRRHQPINQSFRVCKFSLATLKVATNTKNKRYETKDTTPTHPHDHTHTTPASLSFFLVLCGFSQFQNLTECSRQHISPTTKCWRFALMPPWASRHIGGSQSIPTVHRCPKGKAVGGPKCTTSDYKPQTRLTHLREDGARLSVTSMVAELFR